MPKLATHGQLLADQTSSHQVKLKALAEIRDNIEIVQNPQEYSKFLAELLQPMLHILMNTNLNSNKEDQHKVRNSILEILYRCPFTDMLRNYTPDLMKAMLHVVRIDSEDNGLLALKIITELFKSFTGPMEEFVPSFLEIVKTMYDNMFAVVPNVFDV